MAAGVIPPISVIAAEMPQTSLFAHNLSEGGNELGIIGLLVVIILVILLLRLI